MIQELNMTGPVPVNALTGKPKLLLNRVKRLLKHESGNRSVFKPALLLIVFIVFGAALVAVAATGNAKKRQPQHTLTLMINPAQTAGPDTTLKTVKHPQKKDRVAAKKEHEEQKRLDEANLKLEKARQDLEKAQEEVDQARMEVYKERGKIDPQSGATDMEAYQRAMEKSKELMERDKLFQFKMQDEMKHAQEDMKRSHEDQMRSQRDWVLLYSQISREDMEKYRQEWEKYREEWRKAAEQMRKQMQEFYQQHRDSLKLFFPEGPDALVAPVPPVSPLFHLAVPVSPKQPFDLKYLLVIPSDSINSRDVEDSLPSKLKSVEE